MDQEGRWAKERFNEVIESGHWLGNYVNSLLEEHETNGISFEKAGQLLATEKREFEKDLAIARRMLRVYGKLVTAEARAEPPAGQES